MATLSLKNIWTNPTYMIAMGFGSGLSPVMPGTCGTLVGVIIYLLIENVSIWIYTLLLLLLIGIGVSVCGKAAEMLNSHDAPSIVWDEIVGYLLTMIAVPSGWLWLILGFLYFRLFDIWKPWPIKKLDQQVKGGVGIMIDDLVAAAYAWLLLQFSIWFLMPFFSN